MTQLPFCDRSLCLLPFYFHFFIVNKRNSWENQRWTQSIPGKSSRWMRNAISNSRYQAERLQIHSHLTQANKKNRKKTSWNKIVWIYWWFFAADKMLRLQKHMNWDRNKFQCFLVFCCKIFVEIKSMMKKMNDIVYLRRLLTSCFWKNKLAEIFGQHI